MARRGADVFTGRKRRAGRWVALLLLTALAGLGVYVSLDNGHVAVLTQKVLVANLPKELEGFTVLHISDLNGARLGPKQQQVANALKGKRYNAVCLTGDMVGKGGDYYPLLELLQALDPTRPVFFIAGDSDPAPVGGQSAGYHTVMADWVTSMQARGAAFLDAPASLTVGSATVWFSEASQLMLDLDAAQAAYAAAGTRESEYYADVMARTRAAWGQMDGDDLHIVLSHLPLRREAVQTFQTVADASGNPVPRTVDIILAGGLAGGQWRLPFVGPVYGDGWFPQAETVRGYRYAGNLLQYISGGLGTSGTIPLPGFRLFNTPEITLLTFTSVMDEDVLPY